MPFAYPAESQKMGVIGHLEEIRRRIFICLIFLCVALVGCFACGQSLLEMTERPVKGLIPNLVFLGPAEAFAAYCKVVLLAGFILVFPILLYQAWAFFSPAFSKASRSRAVLWLTAALGLFFSGILFSYFVLVPSALQFLLGFGKNLAIPMISLDQYVSFFVMMVLAGGLIFEIPLGMSFLTDVGFLKTDFCRTKRPLVLIGILVAAAVITPTQDIFNMLLMAVPMYLLYEAGISLSTLIERSRLQTRKGTD